VHNLFFVRKRLQFTQSADFVSKNNYNVLTGTAITLSLLCIRAY